MTEPMRYTQWSPPDQVDAVEKHVRAHLSSVADAKDSAVTFAEAVRISREEDSEGGVLVTGELDAEPVAPYLRQDFTPEADIEANPLAVEPIEERS